MIKRTPRRQKIGMYSPYLSILGGGERYFLSIAEGLSQKEDVILYADAKISSKAKEILGINLDRVRFEPEKKIAAAGAMSKFKLLLNLDAFFYMTDGSVFLPGAKRNFLIIQSPSHMPGTNISQTIKTAGWKVLCYSSFMKNILESRLKKPVSILSPSIHTSLYHSTAKMKRPFILTVGRFFSYPHDKKQKILIETFKEHSLTLFKGWRLIVAGGLTEKGGEKVLEDLQESAAGYPIDFKVNVPFGELVEIYKKSTVYWHAAGYGEDLVTHPERAEHFGITTLEAMAAGAVPVVYDGGGQRDIVENGVNGYLWKDPIELIKYTMHVLDHEEAYLTFVKNAIKKADEFSLEHFYEKVSQLLH